MIEFVSYDGEYPCLCMGILTLVIDGTICTFNDYRAIEQDEPHAYKRFWSSGGQCYFIDDFETANVESGPWEVDKDDLPDWLKDRADELARCFNENLEYGCCGGCI